MKRRIVIADDDSNIINLVSLRLGLASFDVLSAYSGPAALELIQRREPHAVVLDVGMPGGGLAALDAIKSNPRTSKLPVMMLTGRCGSYNSFSFFNAPGSSEKSSSTISAPRSAAGTGV